MRFLFKWLRIERPAGVGLHPARIVELNVPPGIAFERCTGKIQNVLGGHVTAADSPRFIEAAFGLVNSERLTVSIDPRGDDGSTVTIQSRRLASAQARTASEYVNALASTLSE